MTLNNVRLRKPQFDIASTTITFYVSTLDTQASLFLIPINEGSDRNHTLINTQIYFI